MHLKAVGGDGCHSSCEFTLPFTAFEMICGKKGSETRGCALGTPHPNLPVSPDSGHVQTLSILPPEKSRKSLTENWL